MAAEFGRPILQNINTPVAPFASVPVARNAFVSQTILDRFGSSAPAQVIHPGSTFDAVLAAGEFRSRCLRRDRHGLSPGARQAERGLHRAFHRRRQASPPDDGPSSSETALCSRIFAHACRRRRLLNRFEFMGYVPYESLPVQYARFKVFVAPVWQESFGQVVPFAMSMGLAVAGNRVGALPEILGDTQHSRRDAGRVGLSHPSAARESGHDRRRRHQEPVDRPLQLLGQTDGRRLFGALQEPSIPERSN